MNGCLPRRRGPAIGNPRSLTRRGGMLLDKCRRRVKALERRRLMAGLSVKAQFTVRRWLSKIAADLQQDAWFQRGVTTLPHPSPRR